ncbi:MAG TPA: elongation factor Ts [Candidatus Portnoybacteria bacterium]|nr:elongation factor Ts [Candidatus Portnoybacteria bacterium]
MSDLLEKIKQLRDLTQAPIGDCRRALEESNGDFEKAKKILQERGAQIAEKKAEREVAQGIVESYIHGQGKIGVLLELLCETDFVSRNEIFKGLAHDLAMQIASMDPKDENELMEQKFIKDSSKTIKQLIDSAIGQLGENIKVGRFVRYEVGG